MKIHNKRTCQHFRLVLDQGGRSKVIDSTNLPYAQESKYDQFQEQDIFINCFKSQDFI